MTKAEKTKMDLEQTDIAGRKNKINISMLNEIKCLLLNGIYYPSLNCEVFQNGSYLIQK